MTDVAEEDGGAEEEGYGDCDVWFGLGDGGVLQGGEGEENGVAGLFCDEDAVEGKCGCVYHSCGEGEEEELG